MQVSGQTPHRNKSSEFLKKLDSKGSYIPLFSTLVGVVNILEKIGLKIFEACCPSKASKINNSYITYIKHKEWKDCFAIIIPAFGNAFIYHRNTPAQLRKRAEECLGNESLDNLDKIAPAALNNAAELYRLAAAQGDQEAQSLLDILYIDKNIGTEQEAQKALSRFKARARNGNIEFQYKLGAFYLEKETEQEVQEGISWLKMAADATGHDTHKTSAQYLLGQHYARMEEEEQALEYYKLAASNGHPEASYYVAEVHEKQGEEELATKFYKLAAESSDPEAQYQLGLKYNKKKTLIRRLHGFSKPQSKVMTRRNTLLA